MMNFSCQTHTIDEELTYILMIARLAKSMTILKGYSLVYLACCLIYMVANWDTLSTGEGWDVVYMVGLTTVGLFGLLIDFILTLLIKNKTLWKKL